MRGGEAASIDGIRNQMEGGIVQPPSRTLTRPSLRRAAAIAFGWSSYPIPCFGDAPRMVTIHVIDHLGEPFLGTGEAAQVWADAALARCDSGRHRRTKPEDAARGVTAGIEVSRLERRASGGPSCSI